MFEKIKTHFDGSARIDDCDGLSMTFDKWRFNLRASNTEPLVRLNIETDGVYHLLQEKVEELSVLIEEFSN